MHPVIGIKDQPRTVEEHHSVVSDKTCYECGCTPLPSSSGQAACDEKCGAQAAVRPAAVIKISLLSHNPSHGAEVAAGEYSLEGLPVKQRRALAKPALLVAVGEVQQSFPDGSIYMLFGMRSRIASSENKIVVIAD